MLRFDKLSGTSLRLMLLIGLVVVSVVPVRAWASAQSGSAPVWIVRSLNTSEYGVSEPRGLAFSSVANTLLLLDGEGNVSLVTMGEESAGTRAIPEVRNDPLNAAFDDRTGSLFMFNRDQAELAKIKADSKGVPDTTASSTRFAVDAFGIADPQGIAFDSEDGRLFVLDAGSAQIVSVASHPTLGFDANKVQRISLNKLGTGMFRGLAYNPGNRHLYVAAPEQKKLYELAQNGDLISTFDLAALGIRNPSAMTFAPSADTSDDPTIYNLFMLDANIGPTRQNASSGSQIVELSFTAPAALPAGTIVLPTTLVHIINTSNTAWNPSAPDPAGIDYWPLTGRLLISDSEVDEMPAYFMGKNVFQSTTAGALTNTCSTMSFTTEPTGVAINPNNNHIFFSTDVNDRVFEVSRGPDGQYCTADDAVSTTNIASLYGITDAEDVAYGNNTLFIADGASAEVYRIPLGANGVLGGGDDGAAAHFDTAALGFSGIEGLGYNATNGTLLLVSPRNNERYLGETTTTGTLLRAYDLGYSGLIHPEDVTLAPGSQNPAVRNAYITDRGVDNDVDPHENDGKVWEIALGGSQPIPTSTPGGTNPPGKATLVSPSGATTDNTPTYQWNRVNNATHYYLWVNGPSGNRIKTWYQASTVCSASTCSVTPTTVLGSGAHTWWIRTWNTAGYGPWSDAMNFSLPTIAPPGAATLVSPSGNITDTTPTYTWNRVSSATHYYLWVNGPSGNVIKVWYQSSAVCGGSTCSVTPATTLSTGAHTWWIRTWNSGGHGPWSTARNFTVSP